MKHLLLIPVLCMMQLLCYAQGNTGLVGHWNFNGNANDQSGNGLNGTVTGATPATGFNNIANTAYLFNGFDVSATAYDNITVPYKSVMNMTAFSICALVYVDSFYAGECQGSFILSRGAQGNAGHYSLHMDDNTYDDDCFAFTPNKMNFLGEAADLYLQPHSVRAYNSYVADSTWICVTTTFDGSTLKTYMDGALKHTMPFSKAMQNSIDILRIGASAAINPPKPSTKFSYPFFGKIDDIRLYNRALNAMEVGMYCDTAKLKIGDPPVDTTDTVDHPPLHIGNNDLLQPIVLPSPAQHEVNVWFPAEGGKGHVQLVNAVGQVMAQQPITRQKMQFNLDNYTPGIYVLKISYNGQLIVKKFLKE